MIIQNGRQLKRRDFKNEKELQSFFEDKMEIILGYRFIATEFVVGNFRIDSLAYDPETKSFKIIEYKNVQNHSLLDQGATYLKVLLEHKADFVLKFNNTVHTNLSPQDFDWESSRVIFVSPVYSTYQLEAMDFKDLPFDLIKVTKYENDTVDIDFIKKKSTIPYKQVIKDDSKKIVSSEVKVYTEEYTISKLSEDLVPVYNKLCERIIESDPEIDMKHMKTYMSFKKNNKNMCDLKTNKNKITIYLSPSFSGGIIPPFFRDVRKIGHNGQGGYSADIRNEDDVDRVMPYIRQVLSREDN